MIDWPDAVTDAISRRRAVLVLGAGVSKNAIGKNGERPPLWTEFLQRALKARASRENHVRAIMNKGDLVTACEILQHKLDDDWIPLLRSCFTAPQYQPADIHKFVFDLDSRIVITMNFDKIYDTFAQSSSRNTIAVHNYYDSGTPEALRSNQRIIVKAHGTIDQPDKMIFTREEYSQMRHEHGAFFDIIDALLLTHTFVFLGSGMEDPNVQMILSHHRFGFPTAPPHYICLPATRLHSDVTASYRRNYGLKALRYSSNDNHAELSQSLEQLRSAVDQRRADLAISGDW